MQFTLSVYIKINLNKFSPLHISKCKIKHVQTNVALTLNLVFRTEKINKNKRKEKRKSERGGPTDREGGGVGPTVLVLWGTLLFKGESTNASASCICICMPDAPSLSSLSSRFLWSDFGFREWRVLHHVHPLRVHF